MTDQSLQIGLRRLTTMTIAGSGASELDRKTGCFPSKEL